MMAPVLDVHIAKRLPLRAPYDVDTRADTCMVLYGGVYAVGMHVFDSAGEQHGIAEGEWGVLSTSDYTFVYYTTMQYTYHMVLLYMAWPVLRRESN